MLRFQYRFYYAFSTLWHKKKPNCPNSSSTFAAYECKVIYRIVKSGFKTGCGNGLLDNSLRHRDWFLIMMTSLWQLFWFKTYSYFEKNCIYLSLKQKCLLIVIEKIKGCAIRCFFLKFFPVNLPPLIRYLDYFGRC